MKTYSKHSASPTRSRPQFRYWGAILASIFYIGCSRSPVAVPPRAPYVPLSELESSYDPLVTTEAPNARSIRDGRSHRSVSRQNWHCVGLPSCSESGWNGPGLCTASATRFAGHRYAAV
jgi:hypothetical protein